MVKRYLSTKFGINLLEGVLRKRVLRTAHGRRTTDACVVTVALLRSSTKLDS